MIERANPGKDISKITKQEMMQALDGPADLAVPTSALNQEEQALRDLLYERAVPDPDEIVSYMIAAGVDPHALALSDIYGLGDDLSHGIRGRVSIDEVTDVISARLGGDCES